jgi:hypothetical protein
MKKQGKEADRNIDRKREGQRKETNRERGK